MANKAGRKYKLVIYQYMLNRWWPMTLLVGLVIFLNVAVLWGSEWYFSQAGQNPLPKLSGEGGTILLAVGSISLIFTFFIVAVRKMAYVRLYDDHLQMVTPFLRLNIAYKRIVRSMPTQMHSLFPPKSLSSWKRDLIEPVWGDTVVVIHLTGYPIPRFMLRLFLSPFFFYDKSAHFVLYVDDWLQFSTELDSRRSLKKTSWR